MLDFVLKVADHAALRYWEDTFLKVIPSIKLSREASVWDLMFEFLKKEEHSSNKSYIFEKLISTVSREENFARRVKEAYEGGSITQANK